MAYQIDLRESCRVHSADNTEKPTRKQCVCKTQPILIQTATPLPRLTIHCLPLLPSCSLLSFLRIHHRRRTSTLPLRRRTTAHPPRARRFNIRHRLVLSLYPPSLRKEYLRISIGYVLDVVCVAAGNEDRAARTENVGRVVYSERDCAFDDVENLYTNSITISQLIIGVNERDDNVRMCYPSSSWSACVR